MPYIDIPLFVGAPCYYSYQVKADPNMQVSGIPFTTYYAVLVNGIYIEGTGIEWDPTPVDAFLRQPLNFVSRSGTNRNKDAIDAYRLSVKSKRTYTLKLVDAPFGVRERYFDKRNGRMKSRRVPGQVWRLVKDPQTPEKISFRSLQINDLSFREVKWTDVGRFDNLVGVIRRELADLNTPPVFHTFYELGELNGAATMCDAFWARGNVNGVFQNSLFHYVGSGTLSSLSSVYSAQVAAVKAVALGRLYKKLKNQKIDLATDLAEVSQTVGMISQAAVALAKGFYLLYRGKILEGLKAILPTTRKETSNVFLAYRYGLSPLLSDINGAAQHLAERIHGIPPKRSLGKAKSRITTVINNPISPSINIASSETVFVTDITVKISARYDIFSPALRDVSRLGFTTPTNVAWELVPFSFVVDWFFPIGNYLSSLSATEGLTLKDVTVTTVIKAVRTLTVQLTPPHTHVNYWSFQGEKSCRWSCSITEVTRHVLESGEIPELPLPRFKNPFSYGHVANAIALIQQMASKSK